MNEIKTMQGTIRQDKTIQAKTRQPQDKTTTRQDKGNHKARQDKNKGRDKI